MLFLLAAIKLATLFTARGKRWRGGWRIFVGKCNVGFDKIRQPGERRAAGNEQAACYIGAAHARTLLALSTTRHCPYDLGPKHKSRTV